MEARDWQGAWGARGGQAEDWGVVSVQRELLTPGPQGAAGDRRAPKAREPSTLGPQGLTRTYLLVAAVGSLLLNAVGELGARIFGVISCGCTWEEVRKRKVTPFADGFQTAGAVTPVLPSASDFFPSAWARPLVSRADREGRAPVPNGQEGTASRTLLAAHKRTPWRVSQPFLHRPAPKGLSVGGATLFPFFQKA